MARFGMNIEDDLVFKLKVYAVNNRTTMTDFIIESIKEKFERIEKSNKKNEE